MNQERILIKLGEITTEKLEELQGELQAYQDLIDRLELSDGLIKAEEKKMFDATVTNNLNLWRMQKGYVYGLENAKKWLGKASDNNSYRLNPKTKEFEVIDPEN